MSAFFIFHNKRVNDPDKLARYKEAVAPVVAAYGGRYRVIGGEPTNLEGDWRPSFLVLIEFPCHDQAADWYDSDDYKALKAQRVSAVDSDAILLKGLEEVPNS